jgi:lysozyme
MKLIAEFEGFSDRPYYATAEEKLKGIVTIGYGNTFYPDGSKVKITDGQISRQKALEILEFTVNKFRVQVKKYLKKEVTKNQEDALVSLAYNIGIGNFSKSTLLKLVNINPNDGNIAKEFLKWNKQAGKELKGLTNRRIKESALYFTK